MGGVTKKCSQIGFPNESMWKVLGMTRYILWVMSGIGGCHRKTMFSDRIPKSIDVESTGNDTVHPAGYVWYRGCHRKTMFSDRFPKSIDVESTGNDTVHPAGNVWYRGVIIRVIFGRSPD